MTRRPRPGRRARRRKGELAHRIKASRTIADAYIAACKAHVRHAMAPRWRPLKRRRLDAEADVAALAADELIAQTIGRPPANPLRRILRERELEAVVRDSRRAP